MHEGTPAEVKLLSAAARYERLWPATVVEVSADALTDDHGGAPFLRALLRAAPAPGDAPAAQASCAPGMAAEVYIKTTERTPHRLPGRSGRRLLPARVPREDEGPQAGIAARPQGG